MTYLVTVVGEDPELFDWVLETHLSCDVGDCLVRPRRAADERHDLVRVEIVERSEAPAPYAARLTVRDVRP
jgi:hypothetical protein